MNDPDFEDYDDDGRDYVVDPCPVCCDDDASVLHTVEDDEDGWYNRLKCNNCGTEFDGHRLSMWE